MSVEQKELALAMQGAFKMQQLFEKLHKETGEVLKDLDAFLLEVAKQVSVDVMPGEQDPASGSLPQRPLNKSYFPTAYDLAELKAVSNPYECQIDDVRVLGTSGKAEIH